MLWYYDVCCSGRMHAYLESGDSPVIAQGGVDHLNRWNFQKSPKCNLSCRRSTTFGMNNDFGIIWNFSRIQCARACMWSSWNTSLLHVHVYTLSLNNIRASTFSSLNFMLMGVLKLRERVGEREDIAHPHSFVHKHLQTNYISSSWAHFNTLAIQRFVTLTALSQGVESGNGTCCLPPQTQA